MHRLLNLIESFDLWKADILQFQKRTESKKKIPPVKAYKVVTAKKEVNVKAMDKHFEGWNQQDHANASYFHGNMKTKYEKEGKKSLRRQHDVAQSMHKYHSNRLGLEANRPNIFKSFKLWKAKILSFGGKTYSGKIIPPPHSPKYKGWRPAAHLGGGYGLGMSPSRVKDLHRNFKKWTEGDHASAEDYHHGMVKKYDRSGNKKMKEKHQHALVAHYVYKMHLDKDPEREFLSTTLSGGEFIKSEIFYFSKARVDEGLSSKKKKKARVKRNIRVDMGGGKVLGQKRSLPSTVHEYPGYFSQEANKKWPKTAKPYRPAEAAHSQLIKLKQTRSRDGIA